MASKKKTNRGGSRVKPGPQANNTSGLLGITFRWSERSTGRAPEVCAAVGAKRYSRTVSPDRPAREALRQLIMLREFAGLPVPTLRRATIAFRHWLTNEAAHYRVAGRLPRGRFADYGDAHA